MPVCFNGDRLIVKDGGLSANTFKNAEIGSLFHQINTVKKPEFIHDLSEGLQRTIQGHKKAYRFTYGAVTGMAKFHCQVRFFIACKIKCQSGCRVYIFGGSKIF